ncbi:hypothetical protein BAE44_0013297 [Dichanthelium oligosanthes]|uniref:Myb/SANT-like domain-containing protein n=1 Tax=Dichanthelium oligosanthes TaxID=888268 RepID=A0A1E5VKP6_9POAL|nr:hypothetical protein BAE44_0013297 [Dichanthelium oligosanthes]
MPGCISFRDAPLENEDQMRIMFDAISVTNETSFVPSSGGGVEKVDGAAGGNDNIEGEGEEQLPITPNGKKKKTFRDQCMKRLVDAYEKKVESSNNSATSKAIDSVREEIGNMLEQVIKDRAEEGSDEHYYATQLLNKKEYRDVFITLKTSNGRLNWLRRAWEDSKKQ